MQLSGFTTIEMVITVILIGIIVAIGLPTIRGALDKTNVRSARVETGTLVATARAAAIQRGCVGVVHFNSSATTVWVSTNGLSKVYEVAGVQNLGARFRVTMAQTRGSLRF